jgi:predicted  nucleic acid-binding Zn-ribbon protein
MEKLFHKINKYSYKLGNSIENNDIQKIDTYTKHHIHHFEQCGKAIIQSGGNMDAFESMLREYIDNVNALVDIYTTKLQELSSLKQQIQDIDVQHEQIINELQQYDKLYNDANAQIEKLLAELESLKAIKASRVLVIPAVGGSIKNNNKINGAKYDIHYIQQYGKAIIQSGGTIGELKESLEGYIAAVAQFLDKYNRMMQEYDAITIAKTISYEKMLKTRDSLNKFPSIITETEGMIAILQSQISALREELKEEEVGLKEKLELKEEVVEGLKEEVEVGLKNPTIKSLIDIMCDADMDRNKNGNCHKSLQRIDKVLHKKFVKSDEAHIFGYNDNDIRKFYKVIRYNDKSEFIKLLKSSKRVYDVETLLRLIRLENIRSILQGKKVNIRDSRGTTIRIDALDDRFDDVNLLFTNNDDAINEIASFFYDKPIPE